MSKPQRGRGKGLGRPKGIISGDKGDAGEHAHARTPNTSLRGSGRDGGYDSDTISRGSARGGRGAGRGVGRGGDNGNPFQARGGRPNATTARAGQTQAINKPPQSSSAQRKPLDEKDQNARFNEVKARRDAKREEGIQAGIIHDVDRPHLFKQDLVPEGPAATCEDMCPEFERLQRIIQNDVMGPEFDPDALKQGLKIPREDRMVKKFRRADAGAAAQGPEDLRTPAALKRTLDHLINNVVGEASHIGNVAHFVWDRTRSVRNDFSIMNSTSIPDLRIQIECLERIIRYHLVSMHQLAVRDQQFGNYSHQQDHEQLTKAMMSLSDLYKLVGDRYHSPNEAEFRSYQIIFQMTDPIPDLENVLQTQYGWREAITKDRQVRRALQLYVAAQNMADAKGPLQPRANHLVTQQCWERFWNVVKSDEISYLVACAAEIFFNLVRRTVLYSIWQSCRTGRDKVDAKMADWTLDDLIEAFAFDEEDEVIEFCEAFGFTFAISDSGVMYLDLSSVKGTQLPLYSDAMPKQYRSNNIVERKRHARNLAAVINGVSIGVAQNAGLIDDEYEEESESQEEEESVGEKTVHAPPVLRSATKGNSLFVTGESDDEDESKARANGPKPTISSFNPQANPFMPSTGTTQATPSFSPFAQQQPTATGSSIETKPGPSTSFGQPSSFGQPTKFGEPTPSAQQYEPKKPAPFQNPFAPNLSTTKPPEQLGRKPAFPSSFTGFASAASSGVQPTTISTAPKETKSTPSSNPFANTFANQAANTTFSGGPFAATSKSQFDNPFFKGLKPSSEAQRINVDKATTQRSESPSSDSSAPAAIPSISIQPPSEAGSDSNRSTPAPGPFPSLSGPSPSPSTTAPLSTKPTGFFPSSGSFAQAHPSVATASPSIPAKTSEQQPSGNKSISNPFGFSASQYPSLSELKADPKTPSPASSQNPLPSFNPGAMLPKTDAKPAAPSFFSPTADPHSTASSAPTHPPSISFAGPRPQASSASQTVKSAPSFAQVKPSLPTSNSPLQSISSSNALPQTKEAAPSSKPPAFQMPTQKPSGIVGAPPQASALKPAAAHVNRHQRKDELFGQMADDLFNEPERGILQQYIEFEIQQAWAAAQEQLAAEKLREEADEFRARKLAMKYCREWYFIVRRIRSRKHGKARRKRHSEAKAKYEALRQSMASEESIQSIEQTDEVNGVVPAQAKKAGEMLPPPLPLPDRKKAETRHRRSRTETTAITKTSSMKAFAHRPGGLPIRSLFGRSTNKMPLINTTQTDHFRRSLDQSLGYDTWQTGRKRSRSIDTYGSDDDESVVSTDSVSPKGKRVKARSSNTDLRKTYTSGIRASLTPSNASSMLGEAADVTPVHPADADLFARVRRLRHGLLGTSPAVSVSASPAPPERQSSRPGEKRQFSAKIMSDPTLHSAEAREIAQAFEDSTSFYREELRRAAERQGRQRSASEASRRVSGGGVSGGSGSPPQHHAAKPAYWYRESKFLPKDQYGKAVLDPNRKKFSLANFEAEQVRKFREAEQREKKRLEEEERRSKLMRGGASIDDAIEL